MFDNVLHYEILLFFRNSLFPHQRHGDVHHLDESLYSFIFSKEIAHGVSSLVGHDVEDLVAFGSCGSHLAEEFVLVAQSGDVRDDLPGMGGKNLLCLFGNRSNQGITWSCFKDSIYILPDLFR
jgi:hypothetical protein